MSDSTTFTKKCPKCRLEFPATSEFFYKNKRGLYGLHSYCKSCHLKNNNSSAKQWQQNHPGEYRAYQRRYAHTEKRQKYRLNYQRKHADKASIYANRWTKNNPTRVMINAHRRLSAKRSLPHTLTPEQWRNALEYFNNCCVYCGKQRSFWHTIEADHFIPLASPDCAGTTNGNMIPACRSCNSSKNDRDPIEWLNWKFGKRRARKILKRIQDYFDSLG